VAITVAAGFLLLGFIGVLIWCMRRQKRKIPVNGGYVMPSTLASSPESGKIYIPQLLVKLDQRVSENV